MRIFVLGTGATGSYLAHLLVRQGHQVTCGDRDLDRAHHFLGKKSKIPVVQVNARNLWGIVSAARSSQLLVNSSASVFNEIVLRAALRIRAHYLDLSAHLTRNPFKAEQLRFDSRFKEKKRAAVITAGAAPGLTNLLVARAAAMMDTVQEVYIRLYESTESDDPVSQWSAEVSFDEAVSRPRIVRGGKFRFGKRFGEPEKFRFPPPIGEATVVVRGVKKDQQIEVRCDALFPSLYQIRQRGLALSPVSYATAQMAALFIKHFPRESAGIFPPGAIPLEYRQAILKDLRSRDIRLTLKVTRKKPSDDEEDF